MPFYHLYVRERPDLLDDRTTYLGSLPDLGNLLSKYINCLDGTLNTTKIRIEIILMSGTPRSMPTISLSSGDSLDRNNLARVSVSSSDCAAMSKGTFSSKTLQPTILFLGLVTAQIEARPDLSTSQVDLKWN
eukprot:TRINITY_DN9283_c0_g2_i11.p1 TRINITY_DN9283_c0_g2~~TRINITY_DN9283_c0_g2_i11.p1  ORF type:complete len:132 (-),score=2.04 TRINITY_DN9283_c0_g2_i11:234-629(-)